MDSLVERCAGLDVHKDTVVACVRYPGAGGGREVELHEFGTTTRDLLALRDWLEVHGVTRVGMEATGVYWKPIYYALEDAMETWLLNARHLKNVPGRKTDMADAAWIAQILEYGLVRPSFVPPKPIRELRNLTRYRKGQIEERTRESQRLDKVLQDAGVKLSSVASTILGTSSLAMLRALVEGTRDPEVLADLAKGALRKKIPMLREALVGNFGPHHALLVGTILSKLEFMDEVIDNLSVEIDRVISPFARQVELLDTIPGVNRRTAEALVAEIGVDMTRFESSARLASWAGLCPGQYESAGRSKRGTTRKGSKWLRIQLIEAAKAASHAKGTYLAAQYARLKGRRGSSRATVAVAHSILVAAFHILDRDQPYNDLGDDWFIRRHSPEHHARKLVAQLKKLGYDVELPEAEVA
ncbi:MAG: IS110 family RNA-guided transposase [Candidatus Dormibacteria bacterium]